MGYVYLFILLFSDEINNNIIIIIYKSYCFLNPIKNFFHFRMSIFKFKKSHSKTKKSNSEIVLLYEV